MEGNGDFSPINSYKMMLKHKTCKVSEALLVTGGGGPWGCEMLRFPHFIDNRLTDGSKAVSLTCQTPFTPKNIPRIFLVLISVRG
jgi:hypothetical protein